MRRRPRRGRDEPSPRAGQSGTEETRAAIAHALEVRRDAIHRSHEIEHVAERLREVRRRNHFGELLTRVLKEGK